MAAITKLRYIRHVTKKANLCFARHLSEQKSTVPKLSSSSDLPSRSSRSDLPKPSSKSDLPRHASDDLPTLESPWGIESQRYQVYKGPDHDKPQEKDYVRELMRILQKDYDISYDGFKNWLKVKMEEANLHDQRFIPQRLDILGPDLAAAYFIVHRGGAIRFKGFEQWVKKDADGKYDLPKKHVHNLYLEAMDLFGFHDIIYEGLTNLEHLKHCKWISFRECPKVDDYFLDWLGIFKHKLEYLDISGCSLVTERGVASLAKLTQLKTLNLSNLPQLQHPELLCLLIEDVFPNCKIIGINYMNESVLSLNDGNSQSEEILGEEAKSEETLVIDAKS